MKYKYYVDLSLLDNCWMDRFNSIFTKSFLSSKKAIAYCQNLARLCGFSVRIRTSKTTTIYIVCSREGHPEPNQELPKKRCRNSERCRCDWRIVLFRRSFEQWEFRSGKTMEHNHIIYSSEAFLDAEITVTHQQPALPPSQVLHHSESHLPSIHSLDLPTPSKQEIPSPTSGTSPPDATYSCNHLPPLTSCLPRIMHEPISRPHSLEYLLN